MPPLSGMRAQAFPMVRGAISRAITKDRLSPYRRCQASRIICNLWPRRDTETCSNALNSRNPRRFLALGYEVLTVESESEAPFCVNVQD